MYREDIIELDSACNAALTGMKAELLQASITIKFNANMSRDMEGEAWSTLCCSVQSARITPNLKLWDQCQCASVPE